MINRQKFFDLVRGHPFGGHLGASQVAGAEAILDGWQASGFSDFRWLAYVLATAFHETARTMQPIREYGKGAGHSYGKPDVSGQAAYGRGLVQITWRRNYILADDKLGLNGRLAKNYDLALTPAVAVPAMIRGMAEGWYTGKKLSKFIECGRCDYKGARRIINGTDRDADIAGYAMAFQIAIMAAIEPAPPPLPVPKPIPVIPTPAPLPPSPPAIAVPPLPPQGFWRKLLAFFGL